MELPEVNVSGAKKLPIKQIIFALVALIIIGEIAWVGWSVYSSVKTSGQSKTGGDVKNTQGLIENLANLSLKTTKTNFAVGEKIPVDIIISAVRSTDGADAVIYYDPKLLEVDTSGKPDPVTAGLIYSDYPINRLDTQSNRIDFSGISISQEGVQPNGVLGTMTFIAKAPGKAKIWFDFKPGSTTDSNVVETRSSQDILSRVEDLELNIK